MLSVYVIKHNWMVHVSVDFVRTVFVFSPVKFPSVDGLLPPVSQAFGNIVFSLHCGLGVSFISLITKITFEILLLVENTSLTKSLLSINEISPIVPEL